MKKINELQLHSTRTSLVSRLLSKADLIGGARSQDTNTWEEEWGQADPGTLLEGSRQHPILDLGVNYTCESISEKFMELHINNLCPFLWICDLY